jgi:AcrR family transcriptional regulator
MKKSDGTLKIAAAALTLIGKHGWDSVTVSQVARTAKVSAAQMKKKIQRKEDILPAIVRMVDKKMWAAVGTIDATMPPRDKLFEILMARIDVLQKHRAAIESITDAARADPSLMGFMMPAHANTMRNILRHTHPKMPIPIQPIGIAVFLSAYGFVICTWRNDTSPDLAKTMAALDRILQRLISLFDIFLRSTS